METPFEQLKTEECAKLTESQIIEYAKVSDYSEAEIRMEVANCKKILQNMRS